MTERLPTYEELLELVQQQRRQIEALTAEVARLRAELGGGAGDPAGGGEPQGVWGNRTESGAKAQGILSSVWQTCKKQAKAALDFVSQTLRAFGNRLLPAPILLGTR